MTNEDQLLELLRQRATDGRITCAEAWSVAEELGVSKAETGQAADTLGIRIKDCQLGCF